MPVYLFPELRHVGCDKRYKPGGNTVNHNDQITRVVTRRQLEVIINVLNCISGFSIRGGHRPNLLLEISFKLVQIFFLNVTILELPFWLNPWKACWIRNLSCWTKTYWEPCILKKIIHHELHAISKRLFYRSFIIQITIKVLFNKYYSSRLCL